MSVFDLPGLMTDADGPPGRAQFLWDRGYRYIVGQAQNGDELSKPVDLEPYRRHAFATGVWGVSYSVDEFVRDARAIVQRAWATNASLLEWNVEECLKNADPRTLNLALDEFDRFSGEKALNTLGAASGANVYPIRYDLFLARGWHIKAQAYPALSLDYEPTRCVAHAERAGIPLERFHLVVSSADEYRSVDEGGMGRPLLASETVGLLRGAGLATPDISIFMSEYGTDDFYRTLEEITMQKAPPAPPQNGPETRAAALKLLVAQRERWELAGVDHRSTRIALAAALLAAPDDKFMRVRSDIAKALA